MVLANLPIFLLLHLVGFGVVSDLIDGRIPNLLTFPGILCAAATRVACCIMRASDSAVLGGGMAGGGPGAGSQLLALLGGMLLPFVLLALLLALHMIGGGDVKILAMIGAFLGPRAAARIILYSLYAGAALSLILMLKRRNLLARLRYFFCYLADALRTGRPGSYDKGGSRDARFCYSVPIAIGLIIYLLR